MRWLFVVLSVAVSGWSMNAEACSCVEPGPPCATMFTSTVFVGTATSVGKGKISFSVDEVLHSAKPLGKTVQVSNSMFCGLKFTAGTKYVVYANGPELQVSLCTRTHEFREGDEDVAFAHALPTRKEAIVEGVVRNQNDEGDRTEQAGVEVRAVGTKVTAKSDGNGRFSLSLPPGTYTLEVVSEGFRPLAGMTTKIELPVAAACATPTLLVEPVKKRK